MNTAAPALPPLTPEELNDLRRKVLAGETVDRETLRRARDQIRQRNTCAAVGVKKKDEAEAFVQAANSNVLDF